MKAVDNFDTEEHITKANLAHAHALEASQLTLG